MKKTRKIILSILIPVLALLGGAAVVYADPGTNNGNGNNGNNANSGNGNGNKNTVPAPVSQTVYLKGSGSNFNEKGWQNIFYVGGAESDLFPSVWHLVYSGKTFNAITEMQITFTNGEVFKWTPSMGPSVNAGGNNMGWVIVAPYDWQIAYVNSGNKNESQSFIKTNEDGNVNFNISGYKKGSPNPKVPTGTLRFEKTVAGVLFADWTLNNFNELERNAILGGVTFELYPVSGNNVAPSGAPLKTTGLNGNIVDFGNNLADGWYAIVEKLSGKAAEVFVQHDTIWVYVNAAGVSGLGAENVYGFNPNAGWYVNSSWVAMGANGIPLYTEFASGMVWDGVKAVSSPANGQQNEVQGITVRNNAGEEYPSFCAHVGSWAYSNGVYAPFSLDANTEAKITSALNYIVDNYGAPNVFDTFGLNGKPNSARILAQMAIWFLLPPDSSEYKITQIYAKGAEYAALNADFANVIAAANGQYVGSGSVSGISYLVSGPESQFGDQQPQIVPLFTSNGKYNNTPKPRFGSITASIDVATEYVKTIIKPYHNLVIQPYHMVIEKSFLVPAFIKDVSRVNTNTLVSKSDDAWNNGHTWVEVNVAEASAEDGVNFEIADSSPQNRPIGYEYNVKIANGKLTISFDDRLIKADVGAYVVNNPSQFPGNAPSHHGDSVTIDMPTGYGAVVYLYFHNQGGISWYATGEYRFAGWQESADYPSTTKTKNLPRLQTSTEVDLPDLTKTKTRTVTCDSNCEYDGAFSLTIDGADYHRSYSDLKNLDSVDTEDLTPGTYTLTLVGDGITGEIVKTIEVKAGEVTSVVFDSITITKDPVTITKNSKLVETITNPSELHRTINKVIKLGDEIDAYGEYAIRLN